MNESPFRSSNHRVHPASLLLSFLLFLGGCGEAVLPEPEADLARLAALAYGPAVEQYDERAAVKARVSAARLDEEWIVVRGVFTPEEAGFHLYSKDLPMAGIEETGRPTFIEIVEGAVQSGTLVADQTPHDFTQYDVTIPIYPEGPVTLYRLARVKDGVSSLKASLTYMSCSEDFCNLPVEGEVVEVILP